MPDQSSAADEHALIEEITAPLATLPEDPVPIASDVDFPVVLRGYDRMAVDDYVRRTSQLVAELQAMRSPEAAVRRALERVGEQISGILQRAHETSGQITAQSRTEAEDRLEVARHEATQVTAAAEQRLRELDADTDRIWSERMRIVEDARQLAKELMALADSAAERFPAASDTASGEIERSLPGEIFDFTAAGEAETAIAFEPEPAGEFEPEPASDLEPEPASELEPEPAPELEPEPAPELDPDATAVFPAMAIPQSEPDEPPDELGAAPAPESDGTPEHEAEGEDPTQTRDA